MPFQAASDGSNPQLGIIDDSATDGASIAMLVTHFSVFGLGELVEAKPGDDPALYETRAKKICKGYAYFITGGLQDLQVDNRKVCDVRKPFTRSRCRPVPASRGR